MIYRDHFQNYKRYIIPKAQLIIADIPYNLGKNAYASNPAWYKDGDNANGESALAGKSFFDTDEDFRPAEFMHFCSTMLKSESKSKKVEGESRQKGEKIHPTQKPVELLKTLISIFTDEGDVVIDPCAGSGSTIVAAERLNRKGYGFEIKKEFYTKAKKWIDSEIQIKKDIEKYGFPLTEMEKSGPTLFSNCV